MNPRLFFIFFTFFFFLKFCLFWKKQLIKVFFPLLVYIIPIIFIFARGKNNFFQKNIDFFISSPENNRKTDFSGLEKSVSDGQLLLLFANCPADETLDLQLRIELGKGALVIFDPRLVDQADL